MSREESQGRDGLPRRRLPEPEDEEKVSSYVTLTGKPVALLHRLEEVTGKLLPTLIQELVEEGLEARLEAADEADAADEA